MLTRSIILFFSVLSASFCAAQILPYQGDLEETQSELFEKIEKADETSSKEAIEFSSQLVAQSKGTEAKTWANLIYASLLTKSDSVAKKHQSKWQLKATPCTGETSAQTHFHET